MHRRLAFIAALALTLTGCDDGADTTGPGGASGPTTLQPAGPEPSEGTARVSCSVQSAHGEVRLGLDLPAAATSSGPCAWTVPFRVPTDDDGHTRRGAAFIRVEAVDDGDDLLEIYDKQKQHATDGDAPRGDDSILNLRFDQDAPTIGPTIGDRLAYDCFCDGEGTISRRAQADGVRITWSSYMYVAEETDQQLDVALEHAGTLD